MNLVELAARNVLRNRRRTALTTGVIAVAAMAIVLLGGYVSATIKAVHTDTVRRVGHVQLTTPGYLEFGRGNPARYAIHDPGPLLERLRADPQLGPMLAVATATLQVQGVAGNFAGGYSSNFGGSGWRPGERRRMLAWDGYGIGFPAAATSLRDDQPAEGVIGVGLAQLLDLCDALAVRRCVRPPRAEEATGPAMDAELAQLVAQQAAGAGPQAGQAVAIELLASGATGAPNVVRMQVAQAEPQGVRAVDQTHVGMPLALAQRLVFGREPPGVSALVLQFHHSGLLEPARRRIEQLLRELRVDLEVHDFTRVAPEYLQIVALFGTMFRFVAILMGVVTLFSVTNTVNMAVGERFAEIGTLRAVGLKRRHVRRMFVIEGGLIGAAGAAVGVAAGLSIGRFAINPAGLGWTPPGNSSPVPIRIDMEGGLEIGLATVLVLGLLAVLSSWWPARRAARLEIVEALRHA